VQSNFNTVQIISRWFFSKI